MSRDGILRYFGPFSGYFGSRDRETWPKYGQNTSKTHHVTTILRPPDSAGIPRGARSGASGAGLFFTERGVTSDFHGHSVRSTEQLLKNCQNFSERGACSKSDGVLRSLAPESELRGFTPGPSLKQLACRRTVQAQVLPQQEHR